MRVGVVGAGVIGRLRAQVAHRHAETELVAVFDPSADAAQQAVSGTGAAPCHSWDQFHALDMDAVIVSSPPAAHEQACLASLAAGRHVLVEKPLSNAIDAARRIVDAAIAARRALAVGFNLRYYPAIAFVREAIADGRIGTLDHVRVFGGHEGVPKFRVDWQYKAPASGGGAMWDVGIHMSDVARYVLDEITGVYGQMTERVWEVPGSEDNAMALLHSPQGVTATYHATWTEWRGYACYVEAHGSKGMVRGAYAPMENVLVTRSAAGTRTKRHRYPGIMVREKLFSWHDTARRSFDAELSDFLRLCRGATDTRIADGFAGVRAIEVALAVRESSRTGLPISLPVLGRMPSVT